MNELELLVEALGIDLPQRRRSPPCSPPSSPWRRRSPNCAVSSSQMCHPAVVFSPLPAGDER